jgi:uncharacterized membrane protein YeaQ/YmgE (transglycosylase-associated protein family)
MTLEGLIVLLIVGAIAGWLAGMIVKGGGFGLIGDIIVGIVGAFIGGWLFTAAHWTVPWGGLAGTVLVAFVGASILLVILHLVHRGYRRPVL